MSHCGLAHLVVASFFLLLALYLSENIYCGLNPDTCDFHISLTLMLL